LTAGDIAISIGNLGKYDSTDVTDLVAEALDLLSMYFGSTLTEDLDDNWNRITKVYATYLLDRKDIKNSALTDPTIIVPTLLPKSITDLVDNIIASATRGTNPETKFHGEHRPPQTRNGEHWRDRIR